MCQRETWMNPFQEIFNKQKAYFDSDATKSYEWRIDQLTRLENLCNENAAALDVVSQEVVNIQAGTGHGWTLVETSMRSMPVVLVDPRKEMAAALGGVLVEAGGSPLADGSLDEAFRFAAGARSGETRALRRDAQPAAVGGEAAGTEAGAVVGEHAAHGNAQAGEVSHRLAQELAGGHRFFVREHGGESDAGVIVDGDVEELPTGAAGFVLRIAGEAMAGFGNAGQLFDVDVQQIAGSRMLVAKDGNDGFERASGVQMQAGEDAADGGAAQAGGLSDAHAGPAFAAQHCHANAGPA